MLFRTDLVLPSIITARIHGYITSCLRAAFHPAAPNFSKLVRHFLTGSSGCCRNPCVSVNLPFHPNDAKTAFFGSVPLGFGPRLRRRHTFRQLAPPCCRSALITANANSNGARYFLVPLLRRYHRRDNRQNVGTVLVCPVGTLTASRTGHVTKLVRGAPTLRNRIATNLCINSRSSGPAAIVRPSGIVASGPALQTDPPSVLLAGCGVLSCLLVRPSTRPL